MLPSVSRKHGVRYFTRRLLATIPNVDEAHAINSTSYVSPVATRFYHDWDAFPATHFWISCYGAANEASQTVTWQLTQAAAPTDPVSASGDDLAITDAAAGFSSGWIAVSDALTGILWMAVSRKGSTATVDFSGRWLDIAFKIDPA